MNPRAPHDVALSPSNTKRLLMYYNEMTMTTEVFVSSCCSFSEEEERGSLQSELSTYLGKRAM
jgi:hypothetical protein